MVPTLPETGLIQREPSPRPPLQTVVYADFMKLENRREFRQKGGEPLSSTTSCSAAMAARITCIIPSFRKRILPPASAGTLSTWAKSVRRTSIGGRALVVSELGRVRRLGNS